MLKAFGIFGIIGSALVAGILAKGPLKGALVGFATALISIFVFVMPLPSPFELLGLAASATGYSIADVDPLNLIISVFSVSGVLVGTAAGAIGGIIRR